MQRGRDVFVYVTFLSVLMLLFSNHSATRYFLSSQTQHFETARPDGPNSHSQAG